MLVTNILGKDVIGKKGKRLGNVIFNNDNAETKAFLVGRDIVFQGSPVEGGTELDLVGTCRAGSYKWGTEELLNPTEDNPIVYVAAKSFRVFEGIPTYIKYITLTEGVLVALVKGCIEVEVGGTPYRLERNVDFDCSELSAKNSILIDNPTLNSLNLLKDVQSDILYSDYVVNDCIISVSMGRDGCLSRSICFNRDNFVALDKSIFSKGVLDLVNREEVKRQQKELDDYATKSYNQSKITEKKTKKSTKTREKEVVKLPDEKVVRPTTLTPKGLLNILTSLSDS